MVSGGMKAAAIWHNGGEKHGNNHGNGVCKSAYQWRHQQNMASASYQRKRGGKSAWHQRRSVIGIGVASKAASMAASWHNQWRQRQRHGVIKA